MKGPEAPTPLQLLLLVGGLTLIPGTLLFTVTCLLTRIIHRPGFIRQGLGTQRRATEPVVSRRHIVRSS